MTPWDPAALYRAATCSEGFRRSGSYNDNVRVDTASGPVLVRIPVPRAAQLDLRLWPEPDVLRVVTAHIEHVPRLLHVSVDPAFQIHEYIPGEQLNEVAPRGVPVPTVVVPTVVALFDQLADIRRDELPSLPAHWPDDGRCVEFAHLLSAHTQWIYDEHRPNWADLFGALGIPDDPLGPVIASWPTLTARPFRLLHADVHRQNMLISPRGVVFLDWELALWGDPVYDLAVHLTKMTYLDGESRRLLGGWAAQADRSTSRGWHQDLAAYLRFEQVKAAIAHSIRYTTQILAPQTSGTQRGVLLDKLTGNLNAAGRVWGWRSALSAAEVRRSIVSHRECGELS